jgi:preprotein translocase subunit YajC
MTVFLTAVLFLPNANNHLTNLVYKSFIIITVNFVAVHYFKLINYDKKNSKEIVDLTEEI